MGGRERLKSLKWLVRSRQGKQKNLQVLMVLQPKIYVKKCLETGCRASMGLPFPIIPREVTIIWGSALLDWWDEGWV